MANRFVISYKVAVGAIMDTIASHFPQVDHTYMWQRYRSLSACFRVNNVNPQPQSL